jgi:hypothetical protein
VEVNIATEMPAHVRHVEEPNLCPLPFRISSLRRARVEPTVTPVPEATMKAFFDALYALPDPDGYADYFP